MTGWNPTTNFDYAGDLTAILRSWEDRFGAYLNSFAPRSFDRTVERPPTSGDNRAFWAAEQLAVTEYYHANLGSLAEFIKIMTIHPYSANLTWSTHHRHHADNIDCCDGSHRVNL